MYQPLSKVYEFHVEVSDSCNLTCSYCYFVAKKKRKTDFSIEKFTRLFGEFIKHTDTDVNLVFHGGEPLMAGAEWIKQACEEAIRLAGAAGRKLCFHLQTNGLLLTDAIIEVLKEYEFTVNVSLDGPRDIHNAARGGYDKTIEGIKKLQSQDLLTGIITVIGKHNYNHIHEVVEELRGLGVKRYHFNVGSILGSDKSLVLPSKEIEEFHKESYRLFVQNYKEMEDWVLLGKLRRFLSSDIPQFACDSPVCGAGIYKIHMLQNGDYYPCGSCVSTQEGIEQLKLGNIFSEINPEDHERSLLNLHKLYFDEKETCEQCDATSICDFYCPAFDRYDMATARNRCEANKKFYEYLTLQPREEIEAIVEYYNN